MVVLKDINSNGVETLLTENEIREFKEIFPEIFRELIKLSEVTYSADSNMSIMTKWMFRVIDYNVSPDPTYLGGYLLPGALKCVMNQDITPQKELRFAYIMGWVLEIIHGSRVISDDIMDCSRSAEEIEGKLPWHNMNNLGMNAINDCFILRMIGYNISKIFFGCEPFYYEIQDTARNGLQRSVLGRSMWEQMEKERPVTNGYTKERYRQVVSFMLSYHSFYLPLEFALIIAGRQDDSQLKDILEELMLQIGYYYQLRKDFDNIFGKKKSWTDHASGKMRRLTWFFVTALEILTQEGEVFGNGGGVEDLTNLIDHDSASGGDNLRSCYKRLKLDKKFTEETKILKDEILANITNIPEEKNVSLNYFYRVLTTIENQTN